MIWDDLHRLANDLHDMADMAMMDAQDISDMDKAIKAIGEATAFNAACKLVIKLMEKHRTNLALSINGPGDGLSSPGPSTLS